MVEAESEWSHLLNAGEPDPSSECYSAETGVFKNREQRKLQELIQMIQEELENAQKQDSHRRPRLDVLEVFADEGSQLTRQCQAAGMHAERLGRANGDFETPEGRLVIWQHVLQHQPRHIWYSPVCSPWSAWSRFNGSRSMHHAKALLSEREARLPQVALGIVLARYQREHQRHFHWEQPAGSSMFMLPHMQEPMSYLQRASFDMCVVGNLRDPENGLPIKKAMQVWTSSTGLLQCLRNRHCRGTHVEHQPLEGQTEYLGHRISRTMFSQKYPRKFARQVAHVFLRRWEKPIITTEAYAVGVRKRQDSDERHEAKRARHRRVPVTTPNVNPLAEWQSLKRRKLESKQPSPVGWTTWQEAFQSIDKVTPRVGRIDLIDHECIRVWQSQVPQVETKALIACRGTDRMLLPPESLKHEPHLVRRQVYIDRHDGILKGEDQWEAVSERPRHQL